MHYNAHAGNNFQVHITHRLSRPEISCCFPLPFQNTAEARTKIQRRNISSDNLFQIKAVILLLDKSKCINHQKANKKLKKANQQLNNANKQLNKENNQLIKVNKQLNKVNRQ